METAKILITAAVTSVCFLAFCAGLFPPDPPKKKKKKRKNPTSEMLHCFNCEYEMPVKIKKGIKFCSNCGLRH